MQNNVIKASTLLSAALGQSVKQQCFNQSNYAHRSWGYTSGGYEETSDLDLLGTLSKNHVMVSIEGCMGPPKPLFLQVNYGIWENGQVTELIGLTQFGEKTPELECETFDIAEGEYIDRMILYYSDSRIAYINMITNNDVNQTLFGDYDWQTDSHLTTQYFSFNNEDQAIFGFFGQASVEIFALGVVDYDLDCVNQQRTIQGDDFSWTGNDSYVSSENSEESCYSYGTTVVRRSPEGNNETILIEDVREGDQVLAKGTQGLFFTEAIVVDLHPSSQSEPITVKTKSGKEVTLTQEHLTITHVSGKQELVPARLIRLGSKVEVLDADGFTMLDEVIDVSPADQSSVKGLANIITGTETIVVNGIVGSIHSENTTKTLARKIARQALVFTNKLAGPKMTRTGYRMAEWMLT